MVKDGTGTTTSKRRSKTAAENEADGDMYKKVVDFEEKEARSRDSDKDTQMYLETCNSIKQLLTDIFQLKCAPTEDKAAILAKRTQACILTSVLKKLNRLEKVRMSAARDALTQEKQRLESINLQFQNLLYEVDHLMSEFRKCKQYKSKDGDIELITVQEFLRVGPEEIISKFSVATGENHELHLAMLEYELCQRIKLAKLLEQMEQEKKTLERDIVNRKAKLDVMEPKLAAVVAATKPLQDHLGLNIGELRAEHKLAGHLPDQLYLLYCNSDAYRKFIDRGMSIDIVGDLDEVVHFNETQRVINVESDPELDSQEEPVEIKKHRHRKGATVDRQEEKKKRLLQTHPLSVDITLGNKESSAQLKLKFLYMPQLRIVTVVSSFEGQTNLVQSGICARDVLTGESVLNQLFEGDTGTESPNPANYFQLKRLGIASFESLVPQLGFAYEWAQKICGLEFLNTQNYKDRLNKLRVRTVEETFRNIEKRLKSRSALATQLHQLETNVIPVLPSFVDHPKTASATLTKFTSITFQKLCQDLPNAKNLVDNEILTCDDLFYVATVSRPKAVLIAWIVIKNDYPSTAPMFLISIKFNGEHTADNSEEVRDMERAINTDWDLIAKGNDMSGWLLSAQMRYLCSYLDVYLETDENSTFPRSTVFFHNVRGRNRRRPYKYRKIGNGIFTQY